jgi:hypothetical protein
VVLPAGTGGLWGYWLVASDGGVFDYGDATFCGSAGAMRLNSPWWDWPSDSPDLETLDGSIA